MNLAVDIGNSYTHLAVFSGQKEVENFNISTNNFDSVSICKKYLKKYSGKIKSAGISSVVPSKNEFWNSFVAIYLKTKPLFISNRINLPIKLKIEKTASLGTDRICNSVFGFEYFKKNENVIVIDFGTANTYDVVLKNADFIGGIIAPGIETSSKALNLNTGKLPLLKKSDFKFEKSLIGKNTKDAIRSGLMNYALYATEGIISSIKKELKKEFKVIITGGNAKKIQNKLSFKTIYIENTVLKGINIILNYNNLK